MRKNKKPFDNGTVIVLFIICIGLLFVLLQTVVNRERAANLIIAADNPQVSFETEDMEQVALQSSAPGEVQQVETGEKAEESGSGILPESQWDGQQEEQTQIQEPEFYEFTVSDKSYFDDALFIGDSRTVGLREYGTLDNADFFASSGLNLYTIERAQVDYGAHKEQTLEEMLQQNKYGKIYVMLGINELGYNFDRTLEKYRGFIDYLLRMQPDAILYVCANLHVNSVRDEMDEIHNNEAINRMNQAISEFADWKDIFYLDVNPLFDDEEGNLAEEYISDDSHVLGVYYEIWCDWYGENTIVK